MTLNQLVFYAIVFSIFLFGLGEISPSYEEQENFTFFLDKNWYYPRDTIHLEGWVDISNSTEIRIEIINPKNMLVFHQKISLENVDEFDQIIPTFGTEWSVPGFYQIKITYQGETQTRLFAFGNFDSKEFEPKLILDKETYSWTDTITMKVISPNDDKNSHQIDKIKINVSGRAGSLSPYVLEETGPSHGVFTGKIKLTGQSDFDLNQDGRAGDVPGYTQGIGPDDGYLSVYPNDLLKISFSSQFFEKPIEKNIAIRFQLASVKWIGSPFYPDQVALARVVDKDMSVRPEIPDHVNVLVKSSIQANSKQYTLEETEKDNGVFEGKIYFHSSLKDEGIFVVPGSTVSIKYQDTTLPSNFLEKKLDIIDNATIIGKKVEGDGIVSTIPSWVKKTAIWWSQGSIGDEGFAQSLNYLAGKKILKITQKPNETIHSPIIPEWLKKTARWWSQNIISDDEVINEIQYLLDNKIIRI